MRRQIEDNVRVDGRKLDEGDPSCRVDLTKRVHGSGLFNRGPRSYLLVL